VLPLQAFETGCAALHPYFRGPWLKVGAGSFAAAKTDGIFPGVHWIVGDEWSSGTDWTAPGEFECFRIPSSPRQSQRLPDAQQNGLAEHCLCNPQLAQFKCSEVNCEPVVPISEEMDRPEGFRREEWQLCGG